MSSTISELRKKSHTQSQDPLPVFLTIEYKINQVKKLIKLALNSHIRICTRVDITSPNGFETSVDFRLTPGQVKQVWQSKPRIVTLHLIPPEHLKKHLPETFTVKVGVNGLLINKIEADFILSSIEKDTPISDKNRKSEKELIEDKVKKLLSEKGKKSILKSSKYQGHVKLREEALRLYKETNYKNKRQAYLFSINNA